MLEKKVSTSGVAAALLCLFCAALIVLLSGCKASRTTVEPRYLLEGTVVSIDKPNLKITVNGKEIFGFMPAMSMPYPVAMEESSALNRIGPGDRIAAEVVVDKKGYRLRHISVVEKGAATGVAVPPEQPARLSRDAVPDFVLLNQDGKLVHLRDFRGKLLLVTFIYTRCPLPDQCPLATHNFATIEKALAKNPALYRKTHLLSISFDPAYDTPAVLRNYARSYGQTRFEHWEFASLSGDQIVAISKYFDLFIDSQQGQINHSMCAAIISTDGTLYRLYPGNEWKPSALLADISTAMQTGGGTGDRAAARHAPAVDEAYVRH